MANTVTPANTQNMGMRARPWIINKSCTIVCQKGSRIDAYAQEYGFQTEYVELSEELDG